VAAGYHTGGTLPPWTITLIPESFVSTKDSSLNRIYGYPVIVTRGVTLYAYSGWVHNIVGNGKDLIAIGAGGAAVLDIANQNPKWFQSERPPDGIGARNSRPFDANSQLYARTLGNTVWSSPIVPYGTAVADCQQITFADSLTSLAVSLPSSADPRGGIAYARNGTDPDNYADVVLQGRFPQYGYYGIAGSRAADPSAPGDGSKTYPFLANFVYTMSAVNYP
jgi:hypothetical protein